MKLSNTEISKTDKAKAAQQIQALGVATKGLTAQQLKLVLSSKQLTTAQRIQILQAQGLTQAEAQAQLQTMGLDTANKTATLSTFSLTGAWQALKVAIATNPIGFIAVALSTAITAIQIFNNKVEEQNTKLKNAAEEAGNTTNELTDLVNKYNTLSKAIQEGSASEDDLLSIQKDLLQALGIKESKLQDLIDKYGSLSAAINQATVDELKFSQGDLVSGVGASQKELTKLSGDITENVKNTIWGGNVTGLDFDKNNEKKYQDQMKALQALYEAGVEGVKLFNGKDDMYREGTGAFELVNGDSVEDALKNYERLKQAQEVLLDNFTSKELSDNDVYLQISERLSVYKNAVTEYEKSVESLNNNLAQQQILSELQTSSIPKTAEEFEKFRELMYETALENKNFAGTETDVKNAVDETLKKISDFNSYYTDIPQENTNITDSYSSLNDVIKDLSDRQSLLSSVQKELTDDGELSFGTIEKLIEAGIEYSDIIDTETGQYKDVATLLKEITKAKYEDEMATMRLTAAEAQHNIVSSAQSGGDFSAYMQQYNDILEEIDIKEKLLEQYYNTEYTPSSSKKSDDPWKEAFEKELKDLQFAKDMELITEKQYYIELEKLNDKYFKGREEYLDEYRKYVVEIYNYQKKLKEQEIQDEIEYLNDLKDAYKTYLEDSQEDLLKPIEDRIEALKEENAQIEKTNKMLEAQKKLEEALQRKNYVYRKGAGFVYEQDQEAVKDAKDEIAKIKREDEIESLEDYRDDVKDKMSETLESIDEFFKTATDKLNGEDKPVNNPDALNNGTLSEEVNTINDIIDNKVISYDDILKSLGVKTLLSSEELSKALGVIQPNKFMDVAYQAIEKESNVTTTVNNRPILNIEKGAVVFNVEGDIDEKMIPVIDKRIDGAFTELANKITEKKTQNQFRRN